MTMDIRIPPSLKVEHEELHAELVALTRSPARVGEAARNVAALLHPHFVKEEEYALPPLGLLATVALGTVTPAMRPVLAMTDRLKSEMPQMLAEHRLVVAALEKLAEAGQAEKRPDGTVVGSVRPEQVPGDDPLAGCEGATSIILFQTDVIHGLTLSELHPDAVTTAYGPLADLVSIARGESP